MAGSLNRSIVGESAANEIETAGKILDKQMNADSCFPSLTDKLQLLNRGGCSVSGLSELDYPGGSVTGGSGAVLRHLHTLRKVPLPKELLHHFQHMQCNCMMGLFPEIERAWLTIDSDIYVWVYKDGSDLAYFDNLHDTILAVALMKPKQGVFKSYIEHLLCLTTPTELVLLGVRFSDSIDGSGAAGLSLLPEPLFSISNDGGAFLMTLRGTLDGRVFMGAKDGSLMELHYQAEDGWFSRKCQKINHSRSALSTFLPSFLTLTEDDAIMQIEVDESRHILYTLSEKGSISVFDLGADGKSTSRIVTIRHSSIMAAANAAAKTVDKANFKSIVSISPIDASESLALHLMAVTSNGVRLYFTTTALSIVSTARPYQLHLVHVRLPPGFSANAVTHRPTKVHKSLYSHGSGVMCANESSENDVVWSVSNDQFPFHAQLAESQAVVSVDGVVWAIADVTPDSLWGIRGEGRNAQGLRPPLVVTQQHNEPRQLVVLSAAGSHILTSLRPVDQLRYLLQDCGGPDGTPVREFFIAMTPAQGCATALILATDPNMQNAQVAEWATQCLFKYGTVQHQTQGVVGIQPSHLQSPGGYSFHPTQISTPVSNPPFFGHQQMPQPQPPTVNSSFVSANMSNLNGTASSTFSAMHNGLYLFLARILRPVWSMRVINVETVQGNQIFKSALSSDECSYLTRKIELFARFMSASSLPNNNHQIGLNVTAGHGSNSEEAASITALCALLQHSLQVFRLWNLLVHHNLPAVVSALPKAILEQLQGMTVRDLVLVGKDVCRDLIMTLLDRFHADSASVTAVSAQLREVCPELFRIEDAQLSRASQLILEAKSTTDTQKKEAGFREAVALCKGVGAGVNVAGIGTQLASGGCYSGLVDLVLSVAGQRDPDGRAVHYYKAGQPHTDTQGFAAFNARMECYRVLIDHLNLLVGSGVMPPASPSVPSRPGPPVSAAPSTSLPCDDASLYCHQMVALVVEGEDELAQVTLFQWLLDTGRSEQLLSLQCSSVEPFLLTWCKQAPQHHLLWRYYERNKQYYKAARTLTLLADQPGSTPLSTRVEHLSRALMCLSSCEMNTASAFTDFLLHLEEKKDVARVQLMVLEGVRSIGGSEEDIAVLNSSLMDISRLYERFAETYQLWECKLAIVACAGHSEPQLIQSLWTHIIEVELNKNADSTVNVQLDCLATKLKVLARQYTTNPQYFPLEHIICVCELKSVQLRADNVSWLAQALLTCGISITKLIHTYHGLYRRSDSVWETERSPFHLLRVLSHLLTVFTDAPPPTLSAPDRRQLKEQCLDRVASYLTDLDASAENSAGIISAHLRTCQRNLERAALY